MSKPILILSKTKCKILWKKPDDEAFWVSSKFPKSRWDQRLADFNRFSNIETQNIVLQLHGNIKFTTSWTLHSSSRGTSQLRKNWLYLLGTCNSPNCIGSIEWKLKYRLLRDFCFFCLNQKGIYNIVLMASCDSHYRIILILQRVGEVVMVEYLLIVILALYLKKQVLNHPNHLFY